MNIEPFKATFYTREEFERHWGQYFQESKVLEIDECYICGFPSLCIGVKISFGVLGIPYMQHSPICSETCFNLWLLQ